MTVVTQFITDDGTDTGDLVETRRIYLQDGKIIENSFSDLPGYIFINSSLHVFQIQYNKFCLNAQNYFMNKHGYV